MATRKILKITAPSGANKIGTYAIRIRGIGGSKVRRAHITSWKVYDEYDPISDDTCNEWLNIIETRICDRKFTIGVLGVKL